MSEFNTREIKRKEEAIEILRRDIARCIILGLSVKEVLKICKDKLRETPK